MAVVGIEVNIVLNPQDGTRKFVLPLNTGFWINGKEPDLMFVQIPGSAKKTYRAMIVKLEKCRTGAFGDQICLIGCQILEVDECARLMTANIKQLRIVSPRKLITEVIWLDSPEI